VIENDRILSKQIEASEALCYWQAMTSTAATPFALPANRWNETAAAGMTPAELLLYRSNLLGSDLTVTNFGGGNTSAKLTEVDPLTGETVEVLWVKGSGGDLGSMGLDGFATLYQGKLLALEAHYSRPDDDDKMVGYLPHCTFNLNPRAASIDTPLHSLLPFAHVDHVHPDAIIALAASSGGAAATREIWGGKIGWLRWKRPGYTLGVQLRDYVAANPGVEGVMLAGHGIICWADSARACYDHTVALIADAANYLNARQHGRPAFGGQDPGGNSVTIPMMPRRSNLSVRPISRGWLRLVLRAPITSCAPRSHPWCSIRHGCAMTPIWASRSPRIARSMPPITSVAGGPARPRCAMPIRWWCWSRAWAGSLSPPTRPPRGWRASSMATRST
jgi:hypothetical protein